MQQHLDFLAVSTLLVAVACNPSPIEKKAGTSSSITSGDDRRAFVVGMPFEGTFDRFEYARPSNHHIIYGADWSTDIYAPSDTEIHYRSDARAAKVTSIAGTCKNGGAAAGGYTVALDLLDASNAVIGRAFYLHVAAPRVSAGQMIEGGTVLGTTKQWPNSTCYDVINENGVHVHFEAQNVSGGRSCWFPSSRENLVDGAPIARLNVSGDRKARCQGEGPPPPPPPPPPSRIAPRPTGGPFQALHVKSPVANGAFISQCAEDASAERVWTTTDAGPDYESRWAEASYPQHILETCGALSGERYPLVFRNHHEGEVDGWIGMCLEDGQGTELVFHVDSIVDGHPAASYLYPQTSTECP